MTDFEPLKEMASFTEDMFNRIIAFQEKGHPAWDISLPFEERIKGLPLHNLIFSNPDRDPQKYGSTVAPYYPLRNEIQKISQYIKQTANPASETPYLCDLYPGNGFIGSLISREGINVIGIHQPSVKPNQIKHFSDASHFTYSDKPIGQQSCDAVLVSWPPEGSNPSLEFIEHAPRLIIYIFTNHIDENTHVKQTGSEEMLSILANDYQLIDQWEVKRPKDILHEIWPDMTPSIEENRQVHIYTHSSLKEIKPVKILTPAQPYDWEKDLQMALLALQAKQTLQLRGFPA